MCCQDSPSLPGLVFDCKIEVLNFLRLLLVFCTSTTVRSNWLGKYWPVLSLLPGKYSYVVLVVSFSRKPVLSLLAGKYCYEVLVGKYRCMRYLKHYFSRPSTVCNSRQRNGDDRRDKTTLGIHRSNRERGQEGGLEKGREDKNTRLQL